MDSLNGILAFPINQIPFVLLVLLIAFTLHEFAHAYTAYKFGDPTPKEMGRVTLNPRAHLDILGTILIFIAGFGWAKPVLVNRSYFKYPRLMNIIVSVVGPLSNLFISIVGLTVWHLLNYFGIVGGLSIGTQQAIIVFLDILIQLNMVLFIFNLIPLPPLDGYHILRNILPPSIAAKLERVQQWAIILFLLMVFIDKVREVTIVPLFGMGLDMIYFFDAILEIMLPIR